VAGSGHHQNNATNIQHTHEACGAGQQQHARGQQRKRNGCVCRAAATQASSDAARHGRGMLSSPQHLCVHLLRSSRAVTTPLLCSGGHHQQQPTPACPDQPAASLSKRRRRGSGKLVQLARLQKRRHTDTHSTRGGAGQQCSHVWSHMSLRVSSLQPVAVPGHPCDPVGTHACTHPTTKDARCVGGQQQSTEPRRNVDRQVPAAPQQSSLTGSSSTTT
jgi:hypothetical protein